MIDMLYGDFMHLSATKFWLMTALACSGAMLIRELSGRLAYGVVAFPLLWVGAIGGHIFLQASRLHFGVDPITDAIVGSIFGMSIVLLFLVFMRQAVNLFDPR